ncbi:pentapeptide repeat-containing protein [Actinoplanes sp. ATCC 53533]|uniref:pentapeptide repeat-containing protein n=1 Tax=Actinoplanes sp. ATCC 53533 TaxID=1288362 RepID=UPI0013158754|nr:pentapeptide repeat-containing protein [Actinoplanes sp. ATCC 53533]
MVRRLTAMQWLAVGAGLLAAAVLLDVRPWGWELWQSVWAALTDHAALVLLGLPSLVALGAAAVALRRARRGSAAPAESAAGSWLLSYPGVLTVATVVAALGVIALVIMLRVAAGSPTADRAKLQIDAIKYGLGIFAAGGAAAALLLGVRRQQHTEHAQRKIEEAQAHTEFDAAQRRVTDLYTKAVEQIGHADAAVRLGGLYALERVAQNNVWQRQTIVDVLCAYLRMPYTPPAERTADRPTDSSTAPLTDPPLNQARPAPDGGRDAHQELQVRLTAQRIIRTHLTLPTGVEPQQAHVLKPDPQQPFWPDTDIDLTGATLVDWRMSRCRVRDAAFDKATFTGNAAFDETTFTGDAAFGETTFTGVAVFIEATFAGDSWFTKATFTGDAAFDKATFTGDAAFDKATFTGDAVFDKTTFTGATWFNDATFTGDARFDKTTFTGAARFNDATFTGNAVFIEATFTGVAVFIEATFTKDARFDKTSFTDDVRFDKTTFANRPELGRSQVTPRNDRRDVWPAHWRLVPAADGMGQLGYERPPAQHPAD